MFFSRESPTSLRFLWWTLGGSLWWLLKPSLLVLDMSTDVCMFLGPRDERGEMWREGRKGVREGKEGGVGERKGGREGGREKKEEVGRSKAEMRGSGRHVQFANTA